MRKLITLLLCLIPVSVSATYDLPNNDTSCPSNCRQIPWLAGSDQWNSGSLPTYTGVNCTSGLTEGDGTTNNASAIQTCLNNLSSNQAAVLPAGIYYVNSVISIPSSKVLRGANSGACAQGTWLSDCEGSAGTCETSGFGGDTGVGATCTALKLGPSGRIRLGTVDSENPTKGSEVNLSSGYTKGSQSITTAASHGCSVNDWIVVFEDEKGLTADPPVSASQSDYGDCNWCGESENNYHVMSQFNKVTSVDSNTLGLYRPLYYTFESGNDPAIKKITWNVQYAGVEDLRINGWDTNRTEPIIQISGALYCWVKNCELHADTNTAKGWPIFMSHVHGCEIRDSHIHGQRATDSDRAYGIGLMFTSSDNKMENNIIREQRHLGAQEGGGAGNCWLYNYMDDAFYNKDHSWKDYPEMNHGAHPYYTLFEGNVAVGFRTEYTWGTSSHGVVFRNHLWGDLTGNYIYSDNSTGLTSTNPSNPYVPVMLDRYNTYYSIVGNVLGVTGMHTTWSAATLSATNCNWVYGSAGQRSTPMVYGFGCDDSGNTYNANTVNTVLRHGNYDYKTSGVAHWDGGADHALPDSYYYDSAPSWWCEESGNVSNGYWPGIGPDITDLVHENPAKRRYDGDTCTALGETTSTTTSIPPIVTTTSSSSSTSSSTVASTSTTSSVPAISGITATGVKFE